MGVQHPPLLVLGQEIIHKRHDKPQHNGQEPRPEDREAEPCKSERQHTADAG